VQGLEQGERAAFNICWEISVEDADSLVMLVTAIPMEAIPAGIEECWFSLGNDFSVQQLAAPEIAVTAGRSHANPVPLGETGRIGDFLLTIGDIAIEPEMIQVPGEARPSVSPNRYLTTRIEAVYIGERFDTLVYDYAFALIGESGAVYGTERTACGELSQGVMIMPELFRGGQSDYALCWKIDGRDAFAPVLSVTDTSDTAAEPVWFALSDE
jgi:hypothetical protein